MSETKEYSATVDMENLHTSWDLHALAIHKTWVRRLWYSTIHGKAYSNSGNASFSSEVALT